MKIQPDHFDCDTGVPKRSEGGMVTVIFIALLAIMMILVMAESRALFNLHREVKRLEQQQIKRLNGSLTNTTGLTATSQVSTNSIDSK